MAGVWQAYQRRLSAAPGVRLAPKQLRSLREADGVVNLWQGAVRSGKTIASILRWLVFIENAPALGELVMVGRTRDTVWRNVILPMQDPAVVGERFAAAVVGNFGAASIKVFGRRVHVLGASDVSAELAIRGMTVAGAYVDEATTLVELFFSQLLTRMSVHGAKLFATTNPDNPHHWLKAKFLDRIAAPKTEEDQTLARTWRVWHFTLDDNPALPEEYREQLRAQFPSGLFHRRYILGEWVRAEGAIYDQWDVNRHVVSPADLPVMERVLSLGIDYGTTNQTAGLLLGLSAGTLYVLDEWAPKIKAGHSLSDVEQSLDLRRWLPSRPVAAWQQPEWLHVDPSAASFRQQLFNDGIQNAVPAWNTVLTGIRQVGSLLAIDRLRVSAACTNLIGEIPGYSWDSKAAERGENVPVKVNDHFCDGLRYAVHSTSPTWQSAVPMLVAA